MMIDHTDPRDLIYTPAEVATIGTHYLDERRHKLDGIPIGLPSLDADLVPLLPGDLCTIVGRPGNGKTGLMIYWARTRAALLEAEKKENRIVAYATWEQSIEHLHAFDVAADTHISITRMARGDITEDEWPSILESSVRRIGKPLWFLGHSLERRKKRPRITVPNIVAALTDVEKWEDERYTIDMIFIDYLQRIPFDGKPESKTVGMDDVLNQLKDCALAFGCPVVVGVQARREVDQRDIPVPMMDDGQWTSAIEQVSDTCLSVMRPRKYRLEGETFGKKNPVVISGERQMLITLLKQKMGIANKPYWCIFDPMYNQLDEAEVKDIDLNADWVR